jgi:hypothetical protein
VRRYLTPDAIRLGLSGLAIASMVGLTWRAAGRTRWGMIPFVVAVFLAARLNHRSDWPRHQGIVAAGALVLVLAGAGAARLLTDPAIGWGWVAAGALVSALGVWAAVPETGPALLVGGSLVGLTATAGLSRAAWAPAAGAGLAAVVGWAALSGASGRPWAAIGGALCAGLAPWLAVRPLLPAPSRGWTAGPWLLCAHAVLVLLAARWIGVVAHAGWPRVAVVATAGAAVAGATRSTA